MTYKPFLKMYQPGNRQATDNLPTSKRQNTKLFLSFSVPRVHSEEMECYEQHVYYYETYFYYIKGKLRGHYVTLKRCRWEEKDEVQQEQLSKSLSLRTSLRRSQTALTNVSRTRPTLTS